MQVRKAKTEDIVISATSVNTYADCPRQFYFSDILAFQEKDGNRDNLAYGNSVHKACQKLVDFAMANGEYPTKEEFLGFFEEDFSKQEISNKKSRLDFLDRANANLSKFYVQMLNTPVNNLYKAEYRISDFEINGVKIKGFIDRIEKLEDGTFALYDYKTGSNKTKEIEDGKSYEKYLNQLRFYKYAFEKSTGNVVSKTGIIFPDDCLENCEKFLQEEDNILIERKIIETKSNIKNMNFEPNPKNKDICANCCYKGICGFGF